MLCVMLSPWAVALAEDSDATVIELKNMEASPSAVEWVLYAQAIALALLIGLTLNAARIFFSRFRETKSND